MKIDKFIDGVKELECIAKEFMDNVSIQLNNVSSEGDNKHRAMLIVRTPYSDKFRYLNIIVSPYADDELLIELNKDDGSHFKANVEGFYKFLWLAAESDYQNSKRV